LTALALTRTEEKLAMGHVFILSNGLSEDQLDAVDLRFRPLPLGLRRLWLWLWA
jgi:hypothetical protein